jgi:hypothetical protein
VSVTTRTALVEQTATKRGWRARLTESWINFLADCGSPLNLAVVRIFVFAAIPFSRDFQEATKYASFPRELIVPPMGMSWLPIAAIDPSIVAWAQSFLVVSCVCAVLGWRTKISTLVATILSVYVLAMPQMLGKTNHNNLVLIWFAWVLSASRCADVLSVDAAIRGWRAARPNMHVLQEQSIVYGLPMKILFLTMGLVYFFPGYWKLHTCGLDWASADHMRLQLWSQWHGTHSQHWRADKLPWLCSLMGWGTIAFENLFSFVVLFPFGRVLLLAIGPLFHAGIAAIMRIYFYALIGAYVTLVDWQKVCNWLSPRLFKQRLTIHYSSSDQLSRHVLGAIKSIDLFGAMVCEEQEGLEHSPGAVVAGNAVFGTDVYKSALKTTIIGWLFLPFLHQIVERQVARGGIAEDRSKTQATPDKPVVSDWRSLITVAVAAAILFAGNVYMGFRGTSNGWPFACFPRFDAMPDSEVNELKIEAFDANGKSLKVPRPQSVFGASQWHSVWYRAFSKKTENGDVILTAIWNCLAERDPSLTAAQSVKYIIEKYDTDPDTVSKEPLASEVVFEFRP